MKTHVHSALRISIAALTLAAMTPTASLAAPLPNAAKPLESFDSGTLHVDRYGTGKRAVVLIPGLGCGPWVWNATIARLAAVDDVYAITLPGFDGRPAAKNEASLFGAFDRDLLALIASRKLDRPAIIGHSLGGTLALAFGESHPKLAGAIVAVDGLPIFPTLAFSAADAREKVADAMTAPLQGMSRADLLTYDTKYMASIGTVDATLVEPTARLEATSDPAAVAAWIHEDLVTDLRPNLAKIDAPVLEIMPYNAPDRTTPPENYTQDQTLEFYRSLLAGTPNATVVAIPDSRHFAMLDQPVRFEKALTTFLDAHE